LLDHNSSREVDNVVKGCAEPSAAAWAAPKDKQVTTLSGNNSGPTGSGPTGSGPTGSGPTGSRSNDSGSNDSEYRATNATAAPGRQFRPRVVATDLDGTLLLEDGTLGEFTQDLLARLDSVGIRVVFVTARPLRWMEELWSAVGNHGAAIVSNGALEYDVSTHQITAVRGLHPADGLAVAQRLREALPPAAFALEQISGFGKEPHFIEGYPLPEGYLCGPLPEIYLEPALKLLVQCPEVPDEALREAAVRASVAQATASWSTTGLVEVSALAVTKASALAALCERWGVAAHEVMAFGDMPNDLPMLQWAGYGVAMANSDPSLLAVANEVAPAHSEEGVAQVLARLL
jgi:Cof subfamily protein (haloacid dehalogenase superfamily)